MRLLVASLLASSVLAQDIGPTAYHPWQGVREDTGLVEIVSRLASDAGAVALCRAHGLELLSLAWEDSARSPGSCWGPNISDLTIQVLAESSQPGGRPLQRQGWCMPVIRHANFADITCDVPIERLMLLVGNEQGRPLQRCDLASYLRQFASHQHAATGELVGSLIDGRDRQVLVSAQACVLPIGAGQTSAFAPVLFNYQSQPGAPRVLVVMATPEGTSAQVITNDGSTAAGVWHGQRLFFNRDGQRAPLCATRLSDAMSVHHPGQAGDAAQAGLSMVLVIQIPLLPPASQSYRRGPSIGTIDLPADQAAPCAPARAMEPEVVTSGSIEGPWLGLAGCQIARDPQFPIRATVQFYQAAESGVLADGDVDRIAHAIDRIYLDADAVGSLVVGGASGRSTEPTLARWPQPWWQGVCEDYTARTGEAWSAALARVRTRLGQEWDPVDSRELRNALTLCAP